MHTAVRMLLYAIGFLSIVSLSGCVFTRPSAQTPTTPDFTHTTWNIVACATFDESNKDATSFRWQFPGMTWSITNGVAMVRGTSRTNKWCGTRVTLPVKENSAELVEISGEFKLEKFEGYHLVGLFGQTTEGGVLCMFFEGRNGKGHYRIQTRWMSQTVKLLNGSSKAIATGEETKRFHKMKMILDRTQSCIHYYADERYMGSIGVDENVEPIKILEMDFESPQAGNTSEVLYDNLMLRKGHK